MKIKVLFNSKSAYISLRSGWGLSMLIGNNILFDTGESGAFLLHNMKELNIDLSAIDAVVISHEHWDHTGGLWDVLKNREGITVYACPGFSDDFKRKIEVNNAILVEVSRFYELSKGIWLTGQINSMYKGKDTPEQALVVDTKAGLVVITGCAHPGIVNMLNIISKHFSDKQLYAVLGGFHLINKSPSVLNVIVDTFKDMGIKKAGPTHCTGSEAEEIFRRNYKDSFICMDAGMILDI